MARSATAATSAGYEFSRRSTVVFGDPAARGHGTRAEGQPHTGVGGQAIHRAFGDDTKSMTCFKPGRPQLPGVLDTAHSYPKTHVG